MNKHVTEPTRQLNDCELDAVCGGIALGRTLIAPPATVVGCPPIPPIRTHVELSELAGNSMDP